ncbi:MAG: MFS transporter [Bacteroidetes bacterium]|nr:MAG: MFS transporter [Bacteroidota bacterium]
MDYTRFFLNNWKILLFAVILTFYSGFGQTFLLSLYIPHIIGEFGISQSLFSTIYASATLCSGFAIIFAGKLIDRIPLIKFTMVVIAGIILANTIAGFSTNLIMLFAGFFLLRFFGQGLLSHTAMTSMGRYFTQARGKALSIAFLGFPLAEAIFPITIVSIILAIGWRESFLVSGLFILVTLVPLSFFLLKNFDSKKVVEEFSSGQSSKTQKPAPKVERFWSQKQIVKDLNFYIYAPTAFITGFTLTAIFFFQTFIAGFKGWSIEWMALSIAAYAISSLVFSVLTGPAIDRFSARTIFPFILIPMAIGLWVLILFSHPAAAVIFWFLTGISAGANPTTGNALYAETYGVKSLGSIRSIFTFVMISSTAAGPVLYSLFIDKGYTYDHIHVLITAVILLNMLFILWGFRKQSRQKMMP